MMTLWLPYWAARVDMVSVSNRFRFAVQGVLVDRDHLLRTIVGKHEELRE
jgi:hypothetical protein